MLAAGAINDAEMDLMAKVSGRSTLSMPMFDTVCKLNPVQHPACLIHLCLLICTPQASIGRRRSDAIPSLGLPPLTQEHKGYHLPPSSAASVAPAPPSPSANLIDLDYPAPVVANPLHAAQQQYNGRIASPSAPPPHAQWQQQQQQQQQQQHLFSLPPPPPPPPPPPQFAHSATPAPDFYAYGSNASSSSSRQPPPPTGAAPLALSQLKPPSHTAPLSLPQLALPVPPRGPKPVAVLEAEGVQLVLKAEAAGELQVGAWYFE